MWMRRTARTSRAISAPVLLLLIACGGDAPCLLYPCPQFEAITVTVAAASGAATLPGLAVAVSGVMQGGGPCDPVGRTCHVPGGAGSYQLTISATGYAPATASLTITGAEAGCNTCGHVDRQQITVTLQPQA